MASHTQYQRDQRLLQIDSGSQVNVISESQIEIRQTEPRIKKSTTTLSAYNGSNIIVKGHCTLDIQHHGKNVPLLFILADTSSPPILGKQLNLVKRIMSISIS